MIIITGVTTEGSPQCQWRSPSPHAHTGPDSSAHSPRDVLSLGSSKPWPEVLQKITGETSVSTKALMTYFKPLLNWLVAENVRQGDVLGWPDFSCSYEGLKIYPWFIPNSDLSLPWSSPTPSQP